MRRSKSKSNFWQLHNNCIKSALLLLLVVSFTFGGGGRRVPRRRRVGNRELGADRRVEQRVHVPHAAQSDEQRVHERDDVRGTQPRELLLARAGIGEDEFPIFASAITGRDYKTLSSNQGVASSRNEEEKRAISDALGQGLIEQIVSLLGRVPRVILLILKTNDLTRSLDENLHTRNGPVRTFMILARYAARCVFQEQVDRIKGSLIWPGNFFRYSVALVGYARVALKLRGYELYLSGGRRLGLETSVI